MMNYFKIYMLFLYGVEDMLFFAFYYIILRIVDTTLHRIAVSSFHQTANIYREFVYT